MADNVTLNPGVGGAVVATDDVGGIQYQRVKMTFGADGVATPVDTGSPLPITGEVDTGLTQPLTNSQLRAAAIDVIPANITGKFREAFETLNTTPVTGKWTLSTGTGDIVQVDGNALAASYLVISKSPWDAGNETVLETQPTFTMPIELAFGAHRSQTTLGQEFSFELVDTGTPLPNVPNLAISSITQTTTTLTVDTVLAHGLVPGKSVGVTGCSNQLANYPALVVASIPSPTQFTCTAGPGGTIPSQTITNPAGAKGEVFFRERLGRANNGAAQIFENASATNASLYIRSESGDALPSGTAIGNHSVTVATTASVQLANTAYTYAFAPTSEFRINLQADRTQWYDSAVDAVAQTSSRLLRTQVCPDPSDTYKLRIRATNSKSLTVLGAKVVSVVKTGTTTGTFTTLTPHGLVTGDLIVYYGNSNTAASAFPNLVTATAVTVNTATEFTAVIGTAATVTGYGGVIAKVQGGNLMSALGANAITAINATLSTLSDGTRQLVLTGSGSWASLLIGDTAEVVGVTNVTNGATLGVDGPWKVANVATTALTLIPATSAFAATLPADFGLTTSGGAVVKRTDLRVSFIRIFDYERERVELMARPSGDLSAAAPTAIQGGSVAISSGTVTTVSAVTAANLNIPGVVADVASAAITSTATVAAITPTFGTEYEVNIPITAVTGTNPTLDIVIQESDDSGTNWYDVWHFPRATAATFLRSPKLPLKGNRVRYVQTVGGTTPSFTRAINRLQGSHTGARFTRRIFDRAISLTTLNATTTTAAGTPLNIQECSTVQLVINVGAITTTAPALQLEGSDDNGVSWYSIGTPLTAVASSTVQTTVTGVNAELVRARVSTAGVGVTAGYVSIKAV